MKTNKEYSLGGVLFPKTTTESYEDSPESLVLLIHGIRTEAHWTGNVRDIFENNNIGCIPVGYGYFDILRFLCPVWTRRFPIKRVTQQIREAKKDILNQNYISLLIVSELMLLPKLYLLTLIFDYMG